MKGFVLLFLLSALSVKAADRAAASASLTDVQAAVDSASTGDTITIPNGTATWTGGLTGLDSKRVIIRALNYTEDSAGVLETTWSSLTNRNVKITANSSSTLMPFTTGNDYYCGVIGIEFIDQSSPSQGGFVSFAGSGTKVGVIGDCAFTCAIRNSPTEQIVQFRARGGLVWNTHVRGIFTDLNLVGEASILIKWPDGIRDWTTAATMGTDDTDGNINVYFEDSTFYRLGQCPDIDDHGRFVARYCLFDTAWGLTHGFTSTWGGRHYEYYNNRFTNTLDLANMAGRYFWNRAGTGVFTDNAVANMITPSEYGAVDQSDHGDNTSPSSYPMNRQPGGGHNGSAYIVDPIYIWNQTGNRAYNWGVDAAWSSMVVEDRDIFVNNGARPSYTKYTYPHPIRAAVASQIGGGGGGGSSVLGTNVLFGGSRVIIGGNAVIK